MHTYIYIVLYKYIKCKLCHGRERRSCFLKRAFTSTWRIWNWICSPERSFSTSVAVSSYFLTEDKNAFKWLLFSLTTFRNIESFYEVSLMLYKLSKMSNYLCIEKSELTFFNLRFEMSELTFWSWVMQTMVCCLYLPYFSTVPTLPSFLFPKTETQRKDTKLTVALTSSGSCRSIRFDPSISLIFYFKSSKGSKQWRSTHSKGFTKEKNWTEKKYEALTKSGFISLDKWLA